MVTRENKSKLAQKNGDRALAKLIGNAVTAAQRAPAETAAVSGAWDMAGVVTVGIQGKDGFRAMDNMTVLSLSREYRRRFSEMGEEMFCAAVLAIRTILLCRAKIDSLDCPLAVEIIQHRGDLCVTVDKRSGGAYLDDPRALQRQLDDACAQFAECLGV